MPMSNVVATPVVVALRATPGIGLGVAAPSYPPCQSGLLGTGEGNYTCVLREELLVVI